MNRKTGRSSIIAVVMSLVFCSPSLVAGNSTRAAPETPQARKGLSDKPKVGRGEISVVATPEVPAPTVTSFADDTFLNADWTVRALSVGFQQVQTLKAENASAGGHPDGFWSIQAGLPAATHAGSRFPILNLMMGYSFDPAKEGAIVEIEGSYDLLSRSPQTSLGLLLLQGGNYFVGPVDRGPSKSWSSFRHTGLKATDFVILVSMPKPSSPVNPDFSCAGKPIQMGFVTTVIKDAGTESSVGVDNWSIRFSSRCCPVATAGKPGFDNAASARLPGTESVLVSPGSGPVRKQCCDDAEATVDANGTVILPNDTDPGTPPLFEYIDQDVGDVKDLYSGINPSLDTWYSKYPCKPSCGGSLPKAAEKPSELEVDLQGIGVKNETGGHIINALSEWEGAIYKMDKEGPQPDWSARAAPPYTPPTRAHLIRRDDGNQYAFGGRDIIFVHGLKVEHLIAKAAGKPEGAQVEWKQPKKFPADSLNREFYKGYFKDRASLTWTNSLDPEKAGGHVLEFLHGGPQGKKPKYMNRYLIVSYSCNERLDVAVKSVLAQIGDAMRFGIGVVDPLNPNGPPPTDFGTPSFVIISHSTGGIVTDVALTAAAQYPSLGAGYIPRYCKAHIAVQGAHRGSPYATAGIALSFVAASNPTYLWLWPLVQSTFGQMADSTSSLINSSVFATARSSILVDLVPLVAQEKWGRFVRETPVRTLTVVGAHPTFLNPANRMLLLGLDDGVLTVESQLASPNDVRLRPSGFKSSGLGRVMNFDLGLFGQEATVQASINNLPAATYTVQFTANPLNNPIRAVTYYVGQTGERFLNPNNVEAFPPQLPPTFFGAGAIPWLSPTGMLLTVDGYYGAGSGEVPQSANPLNRSPLHFSYLQSTSDHFKGTHDQMGPFNGFAYGNSPVALSNFPPGEMNLEETRAITDARVFEPYPMPYGDNQPLLKPEYLPKVIERIRGLRVTVTIRPWFLPKKKWTRSFWVWKRTYHLLEAWETKRQFDYIYESVLKN